ncbi:hypothetical protein SO3561_10020 [Streptomyces olivochromogenes]|uniref:Uncharacterized protein n=1 Tax=Streptomyces olivochromogenes TaxID=1963 RepID=A0A250VW59_STROL|nr:hypothetical protein SO3561_10020 [Streptomyces olivochromogenes]
MSADNNQHNTLPQYSSTTPAAARSAALARWPRPARNTGERAPIPGSGRAAAHPALPLLNSSQGMGKSGRNGDVRGPTTPVPVGVTCTDAAASASLAQEKSQEMPQEKTQELAQV